MRSLASRRRLATALATALFLSLALALGVTAPSPALAQSTPPPPPPPPLDDAPPHLHDDDIPPAADPEPAVAKPLLERLYDLGEVLRRGDDADADVGADAFWNGGGPGGWRDLAPYRTTCDPGGGLRPGAEGILYGPAVGGISIGYIAPRDPLTFVVGDLHTGLAADLVSALACTEVTGREGAALEVVRKKDPMIRAVLDEDGHARLDAALRAWVAITARGATVDVRVVDLPADDPLLDAARPGTPGAATREEVERLLAACRASEAATRRDPRSPAAGPRLLLDERRRVLLGEPVRVRRTRSTSLQAAMELDLTGVVPVAAAATIEIEEGAKVELTAALVPAADGTEGRAVSRGASVRLAVRALEASLDDVRRETFRRTSLELPSCGDRSLRAVVDVPLGAIAVLSLGPRIDPRGDAGPARCTALLVDVRPDGRAAADGRVAPEGLTPAASPRDPREGNGAAPPPATPGGGTARLHDATALLLDPHEPDGGRANPERLIERWRALAGVGDEPSALLIVPGGAALVAGPSEVQARFSSGFAALAREARRPVRIDAWVLVGPPGASEAAGAVPGGPIGAEAARALLSRAAARTGGVSIAGAFGGGALDDGAFTARSRARVAFTGGVDVAFGGIGRDVEVVSAPVTRVVESGVALQVRLGRAPSGALRLDAQAFAQRARLDRTSRAELLPGEGKPLPEPLRPQALPGVEVAVALPSIDRSEVGGRAEIPAAGGFALFAVGGADGLDGPGGEVILLVRATP